MLLPVFRWHPQNHGYGCDGGGYGCWFYIDGASSAFVEVHRTARFLMKQRSYHYMQQRLNKSEVRRGLAPCLASPDRCGALGHSDSGVCVAARKFGWDSVLLGRPRDNLTELVVCHPWCMRTISCDSCPNVLQNSKRETCQCDPSASAAACSNASKAALPSWSIRGAGGFSADWRHGRTSGRRIASLLRAAASLSELHVSDSEAPFKGE